MKRSVRLFLLGILSLSLPALASAKGFGTSGGLTLQSQGARALSMGGAFSSMTDDVNAFIFNPSSLGSLRSGQGSFLYEPGLTDDHFSQLLFGLPRANGGWGLGLGLYDGGKFTIRNGEETRTVTAQKDMALSLGYARRLGGLSVGMTGKYLSSQLVEMATARAFAFDAGLNFAISGRFRVGAAFQNIGTQLKYQNVGDPLPRTFRTGFSYLLPSVHSAILMDAEYLMNEKLIQPSLGGETYIGPMAIRAGIKKGADQMEFTIGSGFNFGRSSLDYAFGLIGQGNSQHLVSYSLRFGGAPAMPEAFASAPVEAPVAAPVIVPVVQKPAPVAHAVSPIHKSRIYVVKAGDTLASIAKKEYGDVRLWRTIYAANRHLIDGPAAIEVGQHLRLP